MRAWASANPQPWILHPDLKDTGSGKGWESTRNCYTKRDMALKFAWWGEADSLWDSRKTSVCYAWWCERRSEQQIIVSILRKDHEFQWFPKARAGDFLRLCPLSMHDSTEGCQRRPFYIEMSWWCPPVHWFSIWQSGRNAVLVNITRQISRR